MGLFEVGQLFSRGEAILPLATNEPTLDGLTLAGGPVNSDLLLV